MPKKIILHLCADIGSDSFYYNKHRDYEVIRIGKEVGVQNIMPDLKYYGIIANPVCTEFSTAEGFDKVGDLEEGMFLVNHCIRIILLSRPKFWYIENPANGRLSQFLGKPDYIYQPWQYGSPWTKKTALWGNFTIPTPLYKGWEHVPKNENLYIRPTREKPSLAFLHKSAIQYLPEYNWCKDSIRQDADLRSLCSMGFARQFFLSNR